MISRIKILDDYIDKRHGLARIRLLGFIYDHLGLSFMIIINNELYWVWVVSDQSNQIRCPDCPISSLDICRDYALCYSGYIMNHVHTFGGKLEFVRVTMNDNRLSLFVSRYLVRMIYDKDL